jgi:hypothetical protein
MAKAAEVTERGVLTIRLPAELHEELRTYKFFTGRSINEVAVELIRDFLDGPGREEIARGMTERARTMYNVALDKLADM